MNWLSTVERTGVNIMYGSNLSAIWLLCSSRGWQTDRLLSIPSLDILLIFFFSVAMFLPRKHLICSLSPIHYGSHIIFIKTVAAVNLRMDHLGVIIVAGWRT